MAAIHLEKEKINQTNETQRQWFRYNYYYQYYYHPHPYHHHHHLSFDDKVKNKIIIIIIAMVNFLSSLQLRVQVPYIFCPILIQQYCSFLLLKNFFVVCLIEQKQEEMRKEQEEVRRLIDEVARDIEISCLGK